MDAVLTRNGCGILVVRLGWRIFALGNVRTGPNAYKSADACKAQFSCTALVQFVFSCTYTTHTDTHRYTPIACINTHTHTHTHTPSHSPHTTSTHSLTRVNKPFVGLPNVEVLFLDYGSHIKHLLRKYAWLKFYYRSDCSLGTK